MLASVAQKLNVHTDFDIAGAAGIGSSDTVGRWKRETRGISDDCLDALSQTLGGAGVKISASELKTFTSEELELRLGLSRHDIRAVYLKCEEWERLTDHSYGQHTAARFFKDPLSRLDLSSDYVGALRRHRGDNADEHFIELLPFRVLRRDGTFCIEHHSLFTERIEKGPVYYNGREMAARIDYADGMFPPSAYLLRQVSEPTNAHVFYGIYLDITDEPHREIFATRFLLFSVSRPVSYADILPGNPLFTELLPILSNDMANRLRLIGEPVTHEQRHRILSIVRATRRALGVAP